MRTSEVRGEPTVLKERERERGRERERERERDIHTQQEEKVDHRSGP